ncbi:MAG: phenylalanine 4-monooxygenase, partial [Patescibacteria group bacterium]
LADLDRELKKLYGFGVSPVEGLVESRIFLGMLEKKFMLCTQYIRHASRPDYTPEPDIVHEVMGHVPMFTDKDFVDFSQMIGAASLKANEEELIQIERLYWFTVEFGLIQEAGQLKAYGAGLLSSFGEIQHCFTDVV